MSIFLPEIVTCPSCGDHRERTVARSVNGERAPHFRDAILAGEFQRPTCEACGAEFEIDHPFLYADLARRQWISVQSTVHHAQWRRLEAEAATTFDRCHGASAPPIAQRLVEGARVRLVFGLDALREKLVCFDAGLDDVVVELVKYDGLGLAPTGEILDARTQARLVGLDDAALYFVVGAPGGEPTAFEVPRAVYDDIAAAPDAWRDLAGVLSTGPYTDVGRLTIRGAA